MKIAKDLIGLKFGKLTVVSRAQNRGQNPMWNCICECGSEIICYGVHLKRGNTKSCGCNMIKKGFNHVQWSGYGEISGQRWTQIRGKGKSHRKARNGLPFEITIEYAWDLFLKQNRKCALSGLDLFFGESNTKETTASLDRIDSKKGYIEGNVQWVHKDINRMKNIFDQEYFLDICKKITENRKINEL